MKISKTKQNNRLIFFLALLFAHCSLLSALDFNLRPKGFIFIPMGSANEHNGSKIYSTGGGGEFGFEADIATVLPNPLGIGYTAGLEGGFLISPMRSDDAETISFYSFGGLIGIYYFPISRLFTRLDTAIGMSVSSRAEARSDPGLFWRLGGEVGYRFTPRFTLAANTGWRQFHLSGTVLNAGMYTGLTAQITFQTGTSGMREGVTAQLNQSEPVYPAFMQLYQSYPIGTVVLRNNENAEIRDVRLFFRAGAYTASEFPSGQISIIPRGRSVELPLVADFSPDILRFTDSGRVMGELVIRYRFLGQEREIVRAATVAIHNRNTVPFEDPASFAAFVSPTSPEALEFARFIAGLDRGNRRIGHNANMQYAMWLFEGLRASGISQGKTFAGENEVRYPAETLSHRTGTNRDLALLFAACLEAVGIPSAFLSISNEQLTVSNEELEISNGEDFLVAVNLGISRNAAETLFGDFNRILVINDEVWLPLSMSTFNDGFTAAWLQGAEQLNRTFTENRQADFVIVQNAWAVYPPAPLSEIGRTGIRTDNAAATAAVNRARQQYIESEITPLLRRQSAMSNEQLARNNGAGFNRLGILQARAGRINEAKAAYERAAGMGSLPAMTNRGNLALAEYDYAAAERWFRQALQRDPQNVTALRGMAIVEENR